MTVQPQHSATPGDVPFYRALRTQWATMLATPDLDLTASYHLLYALLRGHDWRRAFTPITNKTKLENGGFFAWELWRAMSTLRIVGEHPQQAVTFLAPFGGLVTHQMVQEVMALLPGNLRAANFGPSQFIGQAWPFPAYTAPIALVS